jgi:hypothetical protein
MSHAQVAEQLLFLGGLAVLVVLALAAIAVPSIWFLERDKKTGSTGLR